VTLEIQHVTWENSVPGKHCTWLLRASCFR